jgi:hypothetical protein
MFHCLERFHLAQLYELVEMKVRQSLMLIQPHLQQLQSQRLLKNL